MPGGDPHRRASRRPQSDRGRQSDVGRGADRASMLEAPDRAESRGEAQVVVVTGEAGSGRTRLVCGFTDRLGGAIVSTVGHTFPLSGEDLPYGVATAARRPRGHIRRARRWP